MFERYRLPDNETMSSQLRTVSCMGRKEMERTIRHIDIEYQFSSHGFESRLHECFTIFRLFPEDARDAHDFSSVIGIVRCVSEREKEARRLTLPEYIGPISKREGPNLNISALSSSAELKDWYRK